MISYLYPIRVASEIITGPERALPGLITKIEQVLGDVGLPNEDLVVRMTGCPNGCARPYMAEIAFVGKAPYHRFAQAAARSGHYRHLVLQSHLRIL